MNTLTDWDGVVLCDVKKAVTGNGFRIPINLDQTWATAIVLLFPQGFCFEKQTENPNLTSPVVPCSNCCKSDYDFLSVVDEIVDSILFLIVKSIAAYSARSHKHAKEGME